MFQFTTTTLINDNLDYTTKLPRWSAQDEDTTQDPPVQGSFNVKRVGKFEKPNVAAIYKRAYSAPVLAKATLDLSGITAASGIFNIFMYIRLSGNQNSLYSNDMVLKGKPFNIQFEKKTGETAAQLANKLVGIVNKYLNMYSYKYFNVKANGNNLEIEAIDEYQRFTALDVQEYDENAGPIVYADRAGGFVTIFSAKEVTDPEYDEKNTLVQGKEGFGTYQHIIKDLRIPTLDVRRWEAPLQDEVPIINGRYNQYTVYYRKDRGLMGGAAVGQQVVSQTTHVFYVNQAVATDFEAALAKVGTIEEITK
jgi:hypothetical protein|nr:MAG TPA: hypothetical protein [Caudoviricetes sp.]